MDLDQAEQSLDPKICERHDAFVAWLVNPDETVLSVHFFINIIQPVLIFTEYLGDTRDGIDVADERKSGCLARRGNKAELGGQSPWNFESRGPPIFRCLRLERYTIKVEVD